MPSLLEAEGPAVMATMLDLLIPQPPDDLEELWPREAMA